MSIGLLGVWDKSRITRWQMTWRKEKVNETTRAACHKQIAPLTSRTTSGVPVFTPWKRPSAHRRFRPSSPARGCLLSPPAGLHLPRQRTDAPGAVAASSFPAISMIGTRTEAGHDRYGWFHVICDGGTGACCIRRMTLWARDEEHRLQAAHRDPHPRPRRSFVIKWNGRRVLPHRFNPSKMVDEPVLWAQ